MTGTLPDDSVSAAETGCSSSRPAWSAIYAIAFGVAGLITVELMPASVLTPLAEDLRVTIGAAGQTLTMTAVVAFLASLLASTVTRGIDRRTLLLIYTSLFTVSSLIAGFSPNIAVMLFGRALLGIALGGFWAVSAAVAMRLAPPRDVPKALSVIFGGVSVSMVLAAPAGSFLGAVIGWRGVFLAAAVAGVLALIWQGMTLPSMPGESGTESGSVIALLKRPGVAAAMLAIFAVFAGQFAFFSYMRPFFETTTGMDVGELSRVLLIFGICNCIGTSASSFALTKDLRACLAGAPLVLAACSTALLAFGRFEAPTILLVSLWGFVFGVVPVGWSTWITKNLSDEAEVAGGLQVACIQVANALGAAVGGYLLDNTGPLGPTCLAAVLFVAGFAVVLFRVPSTDRI